MRRQRRLGIDRTESDKCQESDYLHRRSNAVSADSNNSSPSRNIGPPPRSPTRHTSEAGDRTMLATSIASLEMEMESELDEDDDEAFLLVKTSSSSSPIRERTRAAHHNGSLPSPTTTLSTPFASLVKSTPSNFIRYALMVIFGIAVIYIVPQQVILFNGSSQETTSRPPQHEILPSQTFSGKNQSSGSHETTNLLGHKHSPSPTPLDEQSNGNLEPTNQPQLEQHLPTSSQTPPPKIQYSCPNNANDESTNPKPANRAEMHKTWYDDISNQLLHGENLTTYLSVYRQTEFDNWGMTYEQVKEASREWKESMFAPVFNDPNKTYTIYESGCGIGLNLALTAEILSETTQVKGVELYGNDYVQASIVLAERLYEEGQIVKDYKAHMGKFCAADSTRLDHVPSDEFDLVYTGYITPLPDPLLIAHKFDTQRDVERAYQAICEDKSNPGLVEQMKAAQEDFYRKWVEEMIRIARPGAPVIVEQVSSPFCEAYFDWGGVTRSFWNSSVKEWPVDASSLLFQDDTHMKKRYHVYFRKQTSLP